MGLVGCSGQKRASVPLCPAQESGNHHWTRLPSRHSAGMPQGELRRHAQTVLSVLASGEVGWGRTAHRRLQSPESQQSRHKVHTMQRTSLLPKACPLKGSPENTAPQKPHL